MGPFRSAAAAAVLCMSSISLAGPPPPAPATDLACPTPKIAAAQRGDPKAREAAQRGLEYLSRASQQWTKHHNCFGCHVQAVTLEALTVGRHHQYDIAPKEVEAMVDALLLGVTAGGRTTGVAFQGAAWARYDRWIDDRRTKDMLRYADELIKLQSPDGSIQDDDARRPITGGTMQTTYQAAQTWRQAYARSADEHYRAAAEQIGRLYMSADANHLAGLTRSLDEPMRRGRGPVTIPYASSQHLSLAVDEKRRRRTWHSKHRRHFCLSV